MLLLLKIAVVEQSQASLIHIHKLNPSLSPGKPNLISAKTLYSRVHHYDVLVQHDPIPSKLCYYPSYIIFLEGLTMTSKNNQLKSRILQFMTILMYKFAEMHTCACVWTGFYTLFHNSDRENNKSPRFARVLFPQLKDLHYFKTSEFLSTCPKTLSKSQLRSSGASLWEKTGYILWRSINLGDLIKYQQAFRTWFFQSFPLCWFKMSREFAPAQRFFP